MNDLMQKTKTELVAEIEKLQLLLAEGTGKHGFFDPYELRQLLPNVEGDELFLVTETGKVVFANESVLQNLNYTMEELASIPFHKLDQNLTRASWLHTVASLKRGIKPTTIESHQTAKDGSLQVKRFTTSYQSYKGKNYVLCIGTLLYAEEAEEPDEKIGVLDRAGIIMNTITEGVLIVDTRGNIVEANAVMERMFDTLRNELVGRSCVDAKWQQVDMHGNTIKVSDHPIMVALVEEISVTNKRIALIQPDGTMKFFIVNASPLLDSADTLHGAVASFRTHDNSDEENNEEADRSRLLTIHREITQAVVGSSSVYELERKLCDTLVAAGGYPLVWVGSVNPNDPKIFPSTSAGEKSEYLLKMKVKCDETELGKGPTGRAVRSKTMQMVPDFSADKSMNPWRKPAEKMGLFSLVVFPLLHENEVIGVLEMYAEEKHHFKEGELALLQEISETFAYGIAHTRNKDVRNLLEREGHRQQQIVEAMQHSVHAATCLFEAKSPFRTGNANTDYLALLDEPFASHGVHDQLLSDYIFSHMHSDLLEQLQKVLDTEEPLSQSGVTFRNWNGEETLWDWSIFPIREAGEITRLFYIAQQISIPPAKPSHPPTPAGIATSSVELFETTTAAAVSQGTDAFALQQETLNNIALGLVHVRVPVIASRGKMEKRIAQMFAEGRVLLWNARACELLGVPLPQLHDLDTNTFFPDSLVFRESLLKAITGKSGEHTFTHEREGDSAVHSSCTISIGNTTESTIDAWISICPR